MQNIVARLKLWNICFLIVTLQVIYGKLFPNVLRLKCSMENNSMWVPGIRAKQNLDFLNLIISCIAYSTFKYNNKEKWNKPGNSNACTT